MRERVTMYGGHLDAGAGPDGGFVVRVVLPLDRDGTAVTTVTGQASSEVRPVSSAALPEVTA